MANFGALMQGKRGLIMGVANNRSIAWGIAKACRPHGAELAFTYQGDALKKRVEPLAAELGAHVVGHCDVTDPATIDAVFAEVAELWGRHRFPRPRHRLLRQGRADRPLRRHHRRQLLPDDADLLLFADRDRPARREADDRRRLDPDAHLLRRREGDAALQRHGRRQGGARGERPLSRRRSRQGRTSASTRSRPARSRRSPPPASATSATSSSGTSSTRRCGARVTIEEVGDAGALSSLRPRPRASPARSTTSMPAITSSA